MSRGMTEERTEQQINIKILVLGPPRVGNYPINFREFVFKSGKTSIANYLADSQDAVSKEYRPTQGEKGHK